MDMGRQNEENVPNLEQLMQLGIQTAKQGNKENARMIFQQVLDADNKNERAWLWMAAVAETPMDRMRFLNTVLSINPTNPTALRELKQLKQRQEASSSQSLVYGAIGLGIVVGFIAIVLLILLIF